MSKWLYVGVLLGVLGILASCGGDDPPPIRTAQIVSFEVDSDQVDVGDRVSISWVTRNAKTLHLRANGSDVDLAETSRAAGSVDFEVVERTELVLVATGGGVTVESEPLTVSVRSPQVLSFTASPDVVEEGEEVTLSWKTSHAKALHITDASGRTHETQGQPVSEGSIVVRPDASTTFTLVAQAGAASDEAQATVRIRGAPILRASASSKLLTYGEAVTFTWSIEEGETLRIERDDVTVHESQLAEGTFTDEPPLTATYRLTAARSGKTAVEAFPVEVMPKFLSLTVPDLPTPIGQEVEVRWHVGGATELLISNGGEFEEKVLVASPDEGALLVPVGPQGAFDVVAVSGNFSVVQTVGTPVLAPPVIGAFTTNVDVISANPGQQALVTLQWSGVERAEVLQLEGDSTGEISIGDAWEEGSIQVSIGEDTEFTLTVANGAGTAEARAFVRVVPFPSILLLAAQPKHVGSGEAFVLTWATTDASTLALTANGTPVAGFSGDPSDSITLQIAADTTYVLQAANDAGDAAEQDLTVTVGSPQVLSFGVSPDYAPAGGTITFSWSNVGGTQLTVADSDGATVCATSVLDEIETGACSITIAAEGTHGFTLTVANSVGGEDTSSVAVVTSVGPRLISFVGSTDRLTTGETLSFSWEVQDDPFGDSPTLSLSDGTNAYDLLDADPNLGSKAFAIQEVGPLTFTLTASTPAGTKTATHDATVHGLPVVTLVASPTEYDSTAPVGLSWTSEYAEESLRIHLVDGTGGLVQPALHEIDAAERGAGSFDVHPAANSTYRIVATNGAGTQASAEANVTMAPPTILSFEAVPGEVVEGDEVTLSWTTRMADSIALDIVDGMLVEEVNSPFTDIRTLGGLPLTFTLNPCGRSTFNAYNEGCAEIALPAGFTFPFGGAQHSSVVMYANGFLGFVLTDFDTYDNGALTGAHPHVAIAPFWDDVEGSSSTYHHLFGSDDRGQYLILQWSGATLWSHTSSLNFQVVLWEDGAFEFRYGSMTASTQARADGSSATIGYRFPDGSVAYTLHQGGTASNTSSSMAGGLSNRSWRFTKPTLEPDGSFVLTAPADDLDVTLTAMGPGGSATADLSIVAHPRARVAVTWPTEEIDAGQPFTIAWTTSNASAVEVLDDQGVRCTAAPAELEAGSCQLTETVAGIYGYTVRATGAMGHEVEVERQLQIYIPISVEAFTVSSNEIQAGEDLLLTWQTIGAASISLTANGQELFDGTEPLSDGTLLHRPQEKTTYVFTVHSADERSRSATEQVSVRTFLFELTADATDVAPGTPVTIHWDVTSLTGGTPSVLGDWPLTEVTDGSAGFEDISGLGQAHLLGTGLDLSTANVTFPGGFEFPFYGQTYSAIRVGVDGWISFNTSASFESTNQPIPNSASYRRFHLPIFWDDLHTQSGRIDAVFLPNPDRLIVQWTNVGRYYPSSTRGYDLNFQIVLFPDGTFEYRYGTMAPPTSPATSTSDCNPLDCTEETQGSSATIGYQDPDGLRGFQLHYGGPSSQNHAPFSGGLSNRSFRFAEPPGGSMVVVPTSTGDYEVCVELGGFRECKTVTVEAAWRIEDFTASAPAIDAQESVTLSWQTKNAENLTLTANGVDVDISTLDFANGSIVLQPQETTNYVLTLHSLGRQTSASLAVEVRQADLQINGPPGLLFPGETVNVSWSATALGSNPVFVYGPMQESSTAFSNIAGHPNVVELVGSGLGATITNHTFANGFEFPFYGARYGSVRVSPDGYLSFDTSTSNDGDNVAIPNAATAKRRIHLAPFWDDLHTRSTGRVHGLHADDGSYVIQWSKVSKSIGSSNSNEYDLNFQVVLFPSGAFEFRYGDMEAPPTGSSSCHPTSDCVGDANGASATIGYQDPSGTHGHQLHLGGTGQAAANTPFPGGLAGRSFRLDPTESTGSLAFLAETDKVIEICAVAVGFVTCEQIRIDVVSQGSVILTEVMIAPAGGASQWFELRNTARLPLDLEGFEISTDIGSHTIGQSLVIPPGGIAVLARAPAVGLQADYTYDAAVQMDPAGDTLAIKAGTLHVTQVSWDGSLPIPTGQSLELDAIAHSAQNHALGAQSAFCLPATSYDGGSNLGTPGVLGGTCKQGMTTDYTVDTLHMGTVFDIQATGTSLITSIGNTMAVDLGFAFPYFGEARTRIWVMSGGFVTVASSSNSYDNFALPYSGSQGTAGVIAPFWADFSYSTHNGTAKWEERLVGGQKVAIFEWYRLKPWNAPSSERITVQLQLWEDGRIVFSYRDLVGSHPEVFGGKATIGFQEPASSSPRYMQYSYDQPSIYEGQMIEFTPVP